MVFTVVGREDDGQAQAVLRSQEQVVVAIFDVVLAQVHRPVLGVGVAH